jgi:multiple sugar transport system substrate-binding protein
MFNEMGDIMPKLTIDRRTFLKYSAGAAAMSMLSPYFNHVRAQDSSTLRVSMWDGIEVQPQVEEIMQGFQEKFGASVEIEYNPDTYNDKLLAGLAAGTAPDVFLWWNYPQLVSRNGLEDLTSYASGSSPLDLTQYYEQIVNVGRSGDGLYGIPKDWTPRAVYFNKKLFDEAKVPYPTNDWTWDDLLETAKALTKGEGPDKQYGWFSYNVQYPLQGFVWSNGGDFISPDGTQATGYLDSPETIEALDWYIRLQTEHGVAPTADESTTVGGETTMFMNGKLAMYDTGIWPLSQFLANPDIEVGTVLPPTTQDGNRACVLHQADWCMNPAAVDKDLSWEVLKWMVSPEAAKVWGKSGFSLPAIKSVTEELGLLEDPIRKTYYDAVDYITVLPWFIRTTKGDEVEQEINLAIQAAFLGQTSIEDALKASAPIIDSILQS